MPKRGIFSDKDGVKRTYMIHKELDKIIKETSKDSHPHISINEFVNYILSKSLSPKLIKKFNSWKVTPRYTKKRNK